MTNLNATQIKTLAVSVKYEEVATYTTTECNMSVERRCESEFKSYGANSTPFLVIQCHGETDLMKDGFDSDEFLAAVRGWVR
ncbi:MAG: hypothetical protein ING36_14570 [Burkholderiales bacterium]|jgi:hypothetical protein|nr:hypothetical protein [Burkholderiales bacterium]